MKLGNFCAHLGPVPGKYHCLFFTLSWAEERDRKLSPLAAVCSSSLLCHPVSVVLLSYSPDLFLCLTLKLRCLRPSTPVSPCAYLSVSLYLAVCLFYCLCFRVRLRLSASFVLPNSECLPFAPQSLVSSCLYRSLCPCADWCLPLSLLLSLSFPSASSCGFCLLVQREKKRLNSTIGEPDLVSRGPR